MNEEFAKHLEAQAEQMEKPMPPCYKNPKNGRIFRATAKLHKHANKMQLVPVHEIPNELKTTKERNLEAAEAKAAAKATEGTADDADESPTDEAEAVLKSSGNTRPGRKPATKSA